MGSGLEGCADALILRIYDTVIDETAWPDLLKDIAEFCNARGAFVFELEGGPAHRRLRAERFSSNYDIDIIQQYLEAHNEAEQAEQEIFAAHSQMSDKIELIPDDVIVAGMGKNATHEDMFALPHMQMQMKFGLKHRAGALLNKDDFYRDRFALQYPIDKGPLTGEELGRASIIMPHLAKAINLARPTRQKQVYSNSITNAIESLSVGICILDANERVAYKNAEFARQIEAYRAMRISRDGKLIFEEDRFDQPVHDLLGHHSNHGKFGARPRKEAVASALPNDPTFALCIEVAPLSQAVEFGEKQLEGHIVYSLDTSLSHTVRTDMMRQLFNLTKSEASIVELLAEGLTNQQISEQRNKSIHTVNSQVKSVLSKTNAANRTQLIRLATNLSMNFSAR